MSARLGQGWRPGLIGWCVGAHGRHYAENWGFGAFFEAKVAHEMGAFAGRLDGPGNHLFWAEDEAGWLATLSLDGDDAWEGLAHLRWFIADPRARGQGLGRRLLTQAVEAARADGAAGIYLWTFKGLEAARRAYLAAGFALDAEQADTTWGREVLEQRYTLRF